MARKLTSLILVVAFATFLVSPVFAGACSKSQAKSAETTETAAKASASAKGGCTAAEKAACAAKGIKCSTSGKGCASMAGVTTADAKLANGHPVIAVADAQKCASSTTAFLSVDKMTCGGCVSHINKTLGEMDGVCAIDVNLENASATVVYHADKVTTETMIQAISKAGYPTTLTDISKVDKTALAACKKSCANAAACTGKKTETSEI